MGEDNPCKRMTSQLRQRNRIQKTSFLKKSGQLAKDMMFPESRETTEPIPKISPNTKWQLPKISKELSQKADKSTPTNILKTIANETIDRIPPEAIRAYTDGSATNATRNGGYGSFISIPQLQEPISIYGPCGRYCNNYDAEVIAIKKTMDKIDQELEVANIIPKDLFILTDSQSALDAIESYKDESSKQIEDLLQICNNTSLKYGINITLQWIPGHCGIYGNEKADALAKLGSNMAQKDETVSYSTAKSLAKEYSKSSWRNSWIQNDKGRALFKHQPAPNPKDAINLLDRKHQCNIFRLRTEHALLNMHRNRLNPLAPPQCRHCNHPYETVEHHLLYCGQLKELRKKFLPDNPTISNCLYGNRDQLTKTSLYHASALRV